MNVNLPRSQRGDRTCRTGGSRGGPRRGQALEVLALEDRQMLSMTISVTNAADSGPGTLRAAVDLANAATKPVTIDFALQSGAAINLTSGQLELSNTGVSIAIKGPGADLLSVDGDELSRVFRIDPNVTASISGLTLTDGAPGGTYSDGGDVLNAGTLTLKDVTVSGGTAGSGGDFYNSGTATIVDSVLTDGTGIYGAGLCEGETGSATIVDCQVTGNVGVPSYFTTSLGGGLYNTGGTLTVDDCTIAGNSAGYGGALTGEYSAKTNVMGTSIGLNPTLMGGMIYESGSTELSMTDCSISGEGSLEAGPLGIYNGYYSQATLNNCTISGFTQGGFWNYWNSSLTMTDTTITNNSGGGALLNSYNSNATLTDCTISNNRNDGDYFLSNSIVTNSGSSMILDLCTFSGNDAEGGGSTLANGGSASLTDCTISGNSADQAGGIVNYGGLSLVASTISQNGSTSAGGGGGLLNYSDANLIDTIVAGNTDSNGPDDIALVGDGEVTGSSNLIGTGGSGGLSASDNLLGVANPGLTPLGDYGGPTEIIALQPNSPARHAGTAVAGVTTDQRGFPLDSTPDIGAFQSQPGPLVVDTAIDGIGSSLGQLSLRQAVNLANVLQGGDAITFDKSAFAGKQTITLTDGPLELSNTTGPISITGTMAAKLTISGGGTSRVFQVDPGATVTLSNLTIAGGATTGNGGGVLNAGSLTLANVVVAGDTASGSGGGVYNSGSLFASNTTISGDQAANGGGIDNAGSAVILGSSIDGNSATSDGGGIDNSGFLSMGDSDLSANSAGLDGGGLYDIGTATLFYCTVDSNAAASGGGIFADPSTTPAVLVGTTLAKNKGGNIVGSVIKL
jgi:hypothetical protein